MNSGNTKVPILNFFIVVTCLCLAMHSNFYYKFQSKHTEGECLQSHISDSVETNITNVTMLLCKILHWCLNFNLICSGSTGPYIIRSALLFRSNSDFNSLESSRTRSPCLQDNMIYIASPGGGHIYLCFG